MTTNLERAGRRRPPTRRALTAGVGGLLAVSSLPFAAAPAQAAVNEPPVAPHNVVVFPERDFVTLEGFGAESGQAAKVNVLRNGVVIGEATGTLGAGDPSLEINHPGGVCWTGSTPDILPGDQVQALLPGQDQAGQPIGESTTTQNAVVTQPAHLEGTDVVVRGFAKGPDGQPLDLNSVEQRIINPELDSTEVGRRDIRAVAGPGERGSLTADPVDPVANPDGANWTARYPGLSQDARDAAVAGQSRALAWQAADAGDERLGITIYEHGEIGGPGFGGCPPAANYGIAGSSPSALNAATNGSDLTLSGPSTDATSVSVSLDDTNPNTPPVEAGPVTPTGGTFSIAVPASAHNALSEGTLTATPTFTLPDDEDPATPAPTIGGTTKQIAKDLVVPQSTTATPAGGTFRTTQSVTLSNPERLPMHFTVDGTDPNTQDPIYNGPIAITASQTLKSIAVDSAGNTSPVRTDAYRISDLSDIELRYTDDPEMRAALGAPVGPEQGNESLRWRPYERGRAYWTPQTGVKFVAGAINAKYVALGAHDRYGVPTTDELKGADGTGRVSQFTGGRAIYWTPQTQAVSIHGAIKTLYDGMGAERSLLGYPTTDETSTPDRIGRFNHFQGGSIYWSPNTGAQEVHGAIRSLWSNLGWERSFLGYPLTSETATPDRIGRFNHFQGGSIYWSPSTGAHEVHGAIRDRWAALGWERSYLGYPTSSEFNVRDGRQSNFQNGFIFWNRFNGQVIDRRY